MGTVMQRYAIYFVPYGSLHAEELSSDTIFGAVCWAMEILRLCNVGQMLQDLERRSPFAFSSAFPFLNSNGKLLHFYPRPLIPELSPSQRERISSRIKEESPRLSEKQALREVIEKEKAIEESLWVSEGLFREIVEGEDMEGLCRRLTRRGARPEEVEKWGPFLLTCRERGNINESLLPPCCLKDVVRNQIERLRGAVARGFLFAEGELFFAKGAGLWCLMLAEEEMVQRLLLPAFRYLEDTGFGGERSIGKGHFKIEVKEAPPLPHAGQKANVFLTLSHYLPSPGEIELQPQLFSYQLISRRAKRESKFPEAFRGMVSPPIYKRMVRLLAPGSLMPLLERKEVYGRLIPVAEGPWKIWHSGLALGTFARIREE